jgi:hypothetical protein
MVSNPVPLVRNVLVDALYKNEALALANFEGLFHVAGNVTFTKRAGAPTNLDFSNPLMNADASDKLKARDGNTGDYFAFVPKSIVQACVQASNNGATKPTLNVTIFFDPFSSNTRMFDSGLRSVFAGRRGEFKVLVCVPGNEDGPNWGIGITNTQIATLLAQCNAGYSNIKVTTLAAWSAGWKGMVATMRAANSVSDVVELKNLERVIFYDCLYFTGNSKGLVDDALTKAQAKIKATASNRQLQVIAYLVTPGGNDSLDPQTVLAGIPFLKKNNLKEGLILLGDSTRVTLRKICIIRALVWALEDGALPGFRVPGAIQAACNVINNAARNTIRSLPLLPYAKGAPAGSTDLKSFASDRQNASFANLRVESAEFTAAVAAVSTGQMIFTGFFPPGEVDHMVIMPELAWEFLAG